MPELVHMDEDTLTHYGRLGMKWGQHIFGEAPRYSLAKNYIPKGSRSVAVSSLTLAQRAAINRHDYLQNIDIGKKFVQNADLSSLASGALEMRIRMARHAGYGGW